MTDQGTTGITFAVDGVEPATERLAERPMHEAIGLLVGRSLSCSSYTRRVVECPIRGDSLVAAVHLAYDDHRPLVLTPDAIWLTIAQGLARHVATDPERWRPLLVDAAGRETLVVRRPEFVVDSPENPWNEVAVEFAAAIADRARPGAAELVVCDFSTTGPVERAASAVCLMDTFRHYYDFVVTCVCGIPKITLEGTVDDWRSIRARVDRLDAFGLEWWTEHLRPIADRFVRAAAGDVDVDDWRRIYKVREKYGVEEVTGWIVDLYPYTEGSRGQDVPNRSLGGTGFLRTREIPSGLSRAPVRGRGAGGERPLEFVAGFFGAEQARDGLALRPAIGWAVRDAAPIDLLLDRLAAEGQVEPPGNETPDRSIRSIGLPADLLRLHARFGRATLGPVEFLAPPELTVCGRWVRFATVGRRGYLAIHRALGVDGTPEWQVLDCRSERPRRASIVARSLAELLERLLESKGGPYFRKRAFRPHGEAHP